jgi:2-dehydro-3-deoxygluconokinase
MPMNLRPAFECELDLVGLGECMVRLSPPPHERIEFARTMEVWVGGGEYNVAYGAARLGLRAGWVSSLADNPVGRIILNHARGAGVDVHHVAMAPYDGLGRTARVGLNFTEVGVGPRPSVTMYDRGYTAATQMKPGDVDWDDLLHRRGVRWLHTGGIFTSLSPSTRQVVLHAVRAAHEAGTFVSYDLNYRASLWTIDEAIEATRPLLPHIHCFIGNIGQFQIVLGRPVEGFDLASDRVEPWALERVVEQVSLHHPHVTTLATTLREIRSGRLHDWSGIMWHEGRQYAGMRFEGLEIEDRIGGGDGFAAGLACGLLNGASPQEALDMGIACGALVQTTPGDTCQATMQEVHSAMKGGIARIVR